MTPQAVHDLLWVVNSPSFLHGENVAATEPLTPDQFDHEQLVRFLGARPLHRVGRYFEQLVHFWLLHVRGVEMLGAGLQIREDKRTIGELDFVYRDEAEVVVHTEVSVKFFLHLPRDGYSHYPGPNASDNFEKKTNKLFDQQLELSRQHFPEVQRREAFVKGMAFYRTGRPQELPERMSQAHATGSWLYVDDVEVLCDSEASGGVIAQKPHWLAPQVKAEVSNIDTLISDVRAHCAGDRPHPAMVSLRGAEQAYEVERLFVVPSHWPNPHL